MPGSNLRNYTRFIPGEEISEAVRWQFGAIAGDGLALLDAAPEVAEQEASPAPVLVDEAQLQQAREEALAEGRRQGQSEAAQEWQQRLDDYVRGQGRQAGEQLAALVQRLEDSFSGLQQQMAEQLLQLACEIARQVVRQELQSNPRALLPVVREALAGFVQDSRPATVRLNPADWKLLESQLREEFGNQRVQWQPDPAVQPGDCSVESAGALVDGALDSRWRRAVGALGLVSAWREMGDGD
ncbi:flagellar assembly protein FliH [Comamonas sp. NLF-1-9]|uniref:FliH/SctL family protein n=1 Tax=Comamonas sp. NLF-1-9 TaxID=2853163 RepID=UPI001C43FCAF|nr:flagellar assembly protein FliH [Comamonas sp. NLF-1-9]QXL84262.1 flagellar assembly protein FliH [Comamonas sp. NLF-1-9]